MRRLLWAVAAGSCFVPLTGAGCGDVTEPLREEPAFQTPPQGLPQPIPTPQTVLPSRTVPMVAPTPLWAWDQADSSRVVDGVFHGVFELKAQTAMHPRWLHIEVAPEETLTDLAQRYGVSTTELMEWNRKKVSGRALRYGTKLRVHAQRFPRHRMRLYYRVQSADETWQSVASAFALDARTLQKFNPRKGDRPLRRGQRLTVWAESALPLWGQEAKDTRPIEVAVPVGATSRGLPTRGSLVDGQRLPESELYTIKRRAAVYASTQTMAQLQRGIGSFRRRTGFAGEVLISSASKAKGGRFPPHLSHQSGRDLDIGLVAFPTFADGQEVSANEVDWGATWALIRELIDSGQVEFVFLTYGHQEKLYEAAQAMSTPEEVLDEVFQYPKGPQSAHGMIRHSPGHERHFHIRFRCGPADRECRSPYGHVLDAV